MKMIEDVNPLKRIVELLREKGINAELCRRTKTIEREWEVLFDERDKNLDITMDRENGRWRNNPGSFYLL